MVTSLENLVGIERNEVQGHSIESDFTVPEGIFVPKKIEARYEGLGESGRDSLLNAGIELSLARLEAKIHRVSAKVSHNLENTIHG